jgi:hypothetical protein
MNIDIKTVKAVYDMLNATKVLREIGLPSSNEIEFELIPVEDKVMATYTPDPDTIGVCAERHRFLTSLIKSVTHEMIHMANHLYGKSYLRHDGHFDELRKIIADELGFDENEI